MGLIIFQSPIWDDPVLLWTSWFFDLLGWTRQLMDLYYLDSSLMMNPSTYRPIILTHPVRTYVIHLLWTYVIILCNWLILWQNAFYLYLGRFRMYLNISRNHISRSSIETFKSVQENKLKVQSYESSTASMCWGLRSCFSPVAR